MQLKTFHLLLVEDSVDDQFFAQEAIDELNRRDVKILIKMLIAGSAEEAMTVLEAQPVDLILLDINLPKESGLTFLRKIKQGKRWRRLPVIMLTTSVSPQDVAQAYDDYCNAYVRKPITHLELLCALTRATDLHFRSAVKPPQVQAHEQ